MSAPKTIIVGAGVAGIAMGHTLKWKLGYSNFEVGDIPGGSSRTDLARFSRSVKVLEGLGEQILIQAGLWIHVKSFCY